VVGCNPLLAMATSATRLLQACLTAANYGIHQSACGDAELLSAYVCCQPAANYAVSLLSAYAGRAALHCTQQCLAIQEVQLKLSLVECRQHTLVQVARRPA
jgi:hypothetical protein